MFISALPKFIRLTPTKKELHTSLDVVWYDYLVIATGVNSNFFGMKNLEQYTIPMKSISEAMSLRNRILSNLEKAVTLFDQYEDEKRSLLNVVVVGGGPTGVEIAGAIAEMKNFVLPKDYPDLNLDLMQISLIEGSPSLLANMSKHASEKSLFYLKRLGISVHLNARVTDYDGKVLRLGNGELMNTQLVIWAAGINGVVPPGIPEEAIGRSRRMLVNEYNQLKGFE